MLARLLVVVAWLLVSAARVHAETIALLPLDSDKKLEIYGQPVAAEIGRALKAQGYDVVVVGAKMDVPDQAQLIVDGTIKAEKATVTLSLRIRDPHNGSTLDTVPPSTGTLTTIDKLAAEVSARLVPAVKTQLAALAKAAQPTNPTNPTNPEPPIGTGPPVILQLPKIVVSVSSKPSPALGLLANGLSRELPGWATQHRREAHTIDPAKLQRATAVSSVVEASANIGIAFEVLGFTVDTGETPMGRARVRVRVVSSSIVLDRVVRTDTIVGDKGITEQEMIGRIAREVLAITNAQLRRLLRGWR